ncbi:MAG: TSUP family transporter [Cyanobacteria bacterium P01_D01_bin.156]
MFAHAGPQARSHRHYSASDCPLPVQQPLGNSGGRTFAHCRRTGVINGITGSQVMPVLPYLLALDLKRDIFITAINLSFTFSSIFMLIGLGRFGLISVSLLKVAAGGTLFVALGIRLGTRIRQRLSSLLYKRLILLLLMVLSINLLLRA